MKKALLTGVALLALTGVCFADGYDLTVKSQGEMASFSGSAATNDTVPIYDASTDSYKNADATTILGLSNPLVALVTNAETLTAAEHGDRIMLVSASGEDQAITLPDGGTETGKSYEFYIGADLGAFTVTIAVPSGDNSSFAGSIKDFNTTDSVTFFSAATFGGSDTITLSSALFSQGDSIKLISIDASEYSVSGTARHASIAGADVFFSSAVTSDD